MLSLGVPGSGTTAVLLAMLISLNVQPGPLLFERQPDLVWGLVASLYMANVALLILNLPMIGIFTRLMMTPTWALMPIVAAVTFGGRLRHLELGLRSRDDGLFRGHRIPSAQVRLSAWCRSCSASCWAETWNATCVVQCPSPTAIGLILVASPISIGLYILTVFFLALSVWLAVRDHRQTKSERLTEG